MDAGGAKLQRHGIDPSLHGTDDMTVDLNQDGPHRRHLWQRLIAAIRKVTEKVSQPVVRKALPFRLLPQTLPLMRSIGQRDTGDYEPNGDSKAPHSLSA